MADSQMNSPEFPTVRDKDSNLLNIKEKLLGIDIVEVIRKHVTLKKTGASYKGVCPFHDEKTPSFHVHPSRNFWKCFGCGKGGNVIDFIIEKKGFTYWEAVQDLAGDYNIDIPKKDYTEEDRKKDLHRESLFTINKVAAAFFEDNLYKSENALALEYARNRWNDETIKLFSIGYAPDAWDNFIKYCQQNSLSLKIAKDAGLLAESKKGKSYDRFRGRLMFPISDTYGRIAGFSGRILPGEVTGNKTKEAKYINSPESEIYTKGNILYGLNVSLKPIKENQFAYLVEGNPDVIRLHEININNVIALSGTGLSDNQAKLIKSLVNKVTIIGDKDPAGWKSVQRSAELLISEGIIVNVILFEDGKGKIDPDSFFYSEDQFNEYVNDKQNNKDYIILLSNIAASSESKDGSPEYRANVVDKLSKLVCKYNDPDLINAYVGLLGKSFPPLQAWKDKIKSFQKENTSVDKRERIPETVDINDFERYGFYADKDGYHFRTGTGIKLGCNFTMKPLFHVKSKINSKRLFELKNDFGVVVTIELLEKDLVSLQGFQIALGSQGNFRFELGVAELNKLKRYLYEKTETCIEITQLGWQKFGFYAWANGIFNSHFVPIDTYGIIRHDDINYYLPALSNINTIDESFFTAERKFIHRDSNKITLKEYSERLINVFGDNAMIALCFYFACLFRDHIVKLHNFFPILNLFGPKGAGKTELAVSMLNFFGKPTKGLNITTASIASLGEHVSKLSNAIVHLDEYKNSLENMAKIEFLKGLWDGTGRSRINVDKDKKTETTAVDSGIILSGQEMPTADIALFSRLIYLSFYKTEYSDAEKQSFTELKEIEKKGLTHITHEILIHRKDFIANYSDHYETITREVTRELDKEIIEDRQYRNWLTVLAAYSVLENKIYLPFDRKSLIKTAVTQMIIQQKETRNSNEVTTFFSLLQYMCSDGYIQEGVDFKIEFSCKRIKTDLADKEFIEPKNILFLQHSRIIPLYRKLGKTNGEKILPADSIDYYLRNDKRFLGKKNSVVFKAVDPKTGIEMTDNNGNKKRKITTAYTFLYDELNIVLHNESTDSVTDIEFTKYNLKPEEADLPF